MTYSQYMLLYSDNYQTTTIFDLNYSDTTKHLPNYHTRCSPPFRIYIPRVPHLLLLLYHALTMADTQSIPIELSLEFESLCAARNAIRTFVIDRGESFRVSHSDRKRYIVICQDAFCKFVIRAAFLQGPKVCITRYIPHTCSLFVHLNFCQAHAVSFLTT